MNTLICVCVHVHDMYALCYVRFCVFHNYVHVTLRAPIPVENPQRNVANLHYNFKYYKMQIAAFANHMRAHLNKILQPYNSNESIFQYIPYKVDLLKCRFVSL